MEVIESIYDFYSYGISILDLTAFINMTILYDVALDDVNTD